MVQIVHFFHDLLRIPCQHVLYKCTTWFTRRKIDSMRKLKEWNCEYIFTRKYLSNTSKICCVSTLHVAQVEHVIWVVMIEGSGVPILNSRHTCPVFPSSVLWCNVCHLGETKVMRNRREMIMMKRYNSWTQRRLLLVLHRLCRDVVACNWGQSYWKFSYGIVTTCLWHRRRGEGGEGFVCVYVCVCAWVLCVCACELSLLEKRSDEYCGIKRVCE